MQPRPIHLPFVSGSAAHELALQQEFSPIAGAEAFSVPLGDDPAGDRFGPLLVQSGIPDRQDVVGFTDEALAAIVIDRLVRVRDGVTPATDEERRWARTAVSHFEYGLEQLKALTRVRIEHRREAAKPAAAAESPRPAGDPPSAPPGA